MTEKRIITFGTDGIGLGVAFLFNAPEGAIELPAGMVSNLAARYRLEPNGQITDLFPGSSDEEVRLILEQRERDAAAALRATKAGLDATTLEGARALRIKEVRAHFNHLIEQLKGDAAAYEVETWAVQRDEYARWLVNPDAATPYVDGLCAGRGITKAELMPKIGVKVAGLASIQGMQHALEKEIEAAETVADVMAVAIPGA